MSDERVEVEAGASRRALFLGVGAAGATAVLAACGTDGGNGSAPPPGGGGPAPGGSSPGADGGGEDGGGEDGNVLLGTGDVEVGGGVILSQQSIVITQPAQGEFKGFSAACTHEGCIVSSVSNGTINCGCHGSQFSIADGSVQRPAPGLTADTQNPLPPVEISVEGSNITRA